MTEGELIKWRAGEKISKTSILDKSEVRFHGNYYFLEENRGAVLKRVLRKRTSLKKMEIAKKAAKILEKIPTIQMVGVTGSLAMENADDESDIDLMIVTKADTLWTTRVIAYLTLKLLRFKLRKPRDRNEKDKLCLNIWMDEKNLQIDDQNLYSAHEIAQIVPLTNKDKTYERLILENSWIKEYWPNAVKVREQNIEKKESKSFFFRQLEGLMRSLQFFYMSGKITRETVTATRAFFHPFDWGEHVKQSLAKE